MPPRILVPSPTEVFQPDDWAKAASEEEGRQKALAALDGASSACASMLVVPPSKDLYDFGVELTMAKYTARHQSLLNLMEEVDGIIAPLAHASAQYESHLKSKKPEADARAEWKATVSPVVANVGHLTTRLKEWKP
ncbi:hypothetical protein [Verrucomicrobium spinosum]|uniref:hypothetical protein n=1 Tax=Verrucomicrobium spinosum TaxID=2736 RepID=UPI0012E1E4DF|nr:hypothetical protein [Verrucomicrobium spinosum]